MSSCLACSPSCSPCKAIDTDAAAALVGTLEVAPGARALVEFHALGSGPAALGDPLLVGALHKGFFGAPKPFALRR